MHFRPSVCAVCARPKRFALSSAKTASMASDLIYPIFVEEDVDAYAPIATMPGVSRIPEKKLADDIKAMYADGIRAVMMFGVSHHKDAAGSDTWKSDGLLARMIKRAKEAAPDMVVMSDTCFCEYTDHGHCGIIENGHVHNDHTINNLARQAVNAVNAGADVIAPSAMMDGQIAALRESLDAEGHHDTPIMAYSSKFASSFYGPFRVAAGCDLNGDRKAYQMDPMNGREALRESMLDEAEGRRYPDGEAGPALPRCAGEYSTQQFATARSLSSQRRIRDDQIRCTSRSD